MSIKQALYEKLINKNDSVKNRYLAFTSAHKTLHKKLPVISLLYVAALNMKFCVFRVRDKKFSPFSLSENETAEILRKADIVSFDIFDTLIFRKTSPADFFDTLGERLGINRFYELRTECESEARRQKKEPEISDIYRIISKKTGISADEGIKAECAAELECCYADPFMLEVYKKLISENKTIIITSDMYLPKAFIEKILLNNGYAGYSDLFVSCEYGCGKADGRLYETIGKKYEGKSIIHTGDNYLSDIINAEKAGFKTLYFNQKKDPTG